MRHKILIGQLPRCHQTDPLASRRTRYEGQLIHLLSSVCFFFSSLFARLSKRHPSYIASHQSSFLCKKVNQGIPPNFSQLLWERAAAAAPCSCWGILYSLYFLFQSHYIMLYCLSLSLVNEHKATSSSSLMTAKLSQMSPCVSHSFYYTNVFFFVLFLFNEKNHKWRFQWQVFSWVIQRDQCLNRARQNYLTWMIHPRQQLLIKNTYLWTWSPLEDVFFFDYYFKLFGVKPLIGGSVWHACFLAVVAASQGGWRVKILFSSEVALVRVDTTPPCLGWYLSEQKTLINSRLADVLLSLKDCTLLNVWAAGCQTSLHALGIQ